MSRKTLTLLTLLSILPATTTFAQHTASHLPHYGSVSRRIAPHEAWHHHSSTAYEGARRGEAAWIAAYGDFLVDQSQAAYVWQHVESLSYDNRLKKTSTALSRKHMLTSYREYERELRRGRQEAAKQLWVEKYGELAQAYRLDEFQFNGTTGAIYWPSLAASPRYAKHRQEIGRLINRSVRYHVENDSFLSDRLVQACENFRTQLRADALEDHPTARKEYLAMQRFLVGLKYTPYLSNSPSPARHFAMQ